MGKEELQELFCAKISLEIGRFKKRMLKQKPEQIYEKAYQIDSMIEIYELLLEMSQKIGTEALKKLLVIPNLLTFLYERWLKTEDSRTKEIWSCLKEQISQIEKAYESSVGKDEANGKISIDIKLG